MMLFGPSRRGSKRAVLSSRNLQYKRRFTFLPYSRRFALARIIRFQPKGLPENPFHLIFSRSRDSEGSRQQRRVWGRRWEYEQKNGVVSETSSEYVPGKGWVDVGPGHSKVEEDKKDFGSSNEEFDIDLITLRRVPKEKAAEQPLKKPDTTRKNPGLSASKSYDKVGSTTDANSQLLQIEPLPVNEEHSEPPPPSTACKSTKGRPKKSQNSDSVVSESSSAPDKPPHVPPKAAKEKDKKETSPINAPSESSLASSQAKTGVAQDASQSSLLVNPPKTSKAVPKEVLSKETTHEGLSAPQNVESGKKAKKISSKEKTTSEPKDHRGVLGEILNDQKQALEKMAPPPLSSKPAKSGETITDVLDTLNRDIKELQAAGEVKPLSAPAQAKQSEDSLDFAALSDVKTNKKPSNLPSKLIEPLDAKAGGSAKGAAENVGMTLENTVLTAPESVTTRGTSTGSTNLEGAASVAEGVSRPILPIPTEPLDKSGSTVTKSLAPGSTQTLEKRSPSPSPVPVESNTQGNGAAPSGLAAPQLITLELAEPILQTDSGVVADSPADGSAGRLNENIPPRSPDPVEPPNMIANSAITTPNSVAPATPPSEIRKGSPVPSFFANDSVTGILEEVRGATPLLSESLAKESFKYHKLNIANRPGEDLGSPDADVDILLPSDVRAAAGAPGKTVTRIESVAEKQQRWAKIVEEFEAYYEQEKSETFEIRKNMREKVQQSLETAHGEAIKEVHGQTSNTTFDGGIASKLQSSENLSKSGGLKSPEENEDYLWSGTENVSAEDVLGTTKPFTKQPQAPVLASSLAAQQTVLEADGGPSRLAASHAVHKFFALVRNPETGNIQCTVLPQGIVNDVMTRGNTAFDSLQNLDSPESFLPLWRVLQKGGFTVVGGEKDCLVVKVEAEVARAKQELVLKEIKLKLSPAESVARESWERKRGMNKFGTEKELETAEDIVATITSQPRPTVAQETISSTVSTRLKPRPESETTHQEIDEVLRGEEKSSEIVSKVQGGRSKKSRPFRRVFWAAVWVAACSGAVNMGLEEYL